MQNKLANFQRDKKFLISQILKIIEESEEDVSFAYKCFLSDFIFVIYTNIAVRRSLI